jgi:hypothetical protein
VEINVNHKNQGEGDKQSARRFNKDETKFVKDGGAAGKPEPVKSGDRAAEALGKARAKRGDQDQRDAAKMRDAVASKK